MGTVTIKRQVRELEAMEYSVPYLCGSHMNLYMLQFIELNTSKKSVLL